VSTPCLKKKGRRGCKGLTSVLGEGPAELVNAGGNLQALLENSPLALDADVLGPPDKAPEVPLGLDSAADGEVLGGLLDEGVHNLLLLGLGGGLALEASREGGNLLALSDLALSGLGGGLGGGSGLGSGGLASGGSGLLGSRGSGLVTGLGGSGLRGGGLGSSGSSLGSWGGGGLRGLHFERVRLVTNDIGENKLNNINNPKLSHVIQCGAGNEK